MCCENTEKNLCNFERENILKIVSQFPFEGRVKTIDPFGIDFIPYFAKYN